MSSLAWNGNPVLKSPERMVVDVYQNFERWCSNSTEFEDRAMLEHNISTPVVEFQFYKHAEPTAREVCFESKKLVFKPLRNESLPAFKKFESENRVYLIELKRYLERFSSGLPGSELNLSN